MHLPLRCFKPARRHIGPLTWGTSSRKKGVLCGPQGLDGEVSRCFATRGGAPCERGVSRFVLRGLEQFSKNSIGVELGGGGVGTSFLVSYDLGRYPPSIDGKVLRGGTPPKCCASHSHLKH